MAVPVIDADALARLLPMRGAIDALHEGFGAERLPEAPLRTHVETRSGTLYLMPSHGSRGVGVKLVTLTVANPERGLPFIHAVYALFDAETQAPVAIVDGTSLTALRTAAVSGLATRFLAREDARRLVLYGAGVQARSHLEAMRAVRPIEEVVVVSRSPERAGALVGEAAASGLAAWVGEPGAERDADIVCTCTTSETPVVSGSALPTGVHVNAVGAYLPTLREVDTDGVRRAKVVVETREAAMAEAGDLLIPIAEGAIGSDHVVADLAEVVGGMSVRGSSDDITLFKSVGIAFEDLIVARAAADRR
ncbi:MAG: ornithine cyclodeaminase family protein [Actinobacteria bacterium]|nr:ornithine cyclodeaminase family protein [Actinomycetota bacterium]